MKRKYKNEKIKVGDWVYFLDDYENFMRLNVNIKRVKELMNIGDKIVIKYNGDTVHFGQCYDGMTGIINNYFANRYRITLDEKSRRKINEINYRTNSCWTMFPTIPFQYVYVYNKNLEIE